ncbi:MAG: ATP:cob(I)alamin adenosyltransferase [Propionibacteriales bacterium]|nr:MAG: ATP:cob(I)alamin adenosyltransferase [Propionibacteriales bacterium]
MVRLTKIYTRTGDGGSTRLANNEITDKLDPRIAAYGTVDEVNSWLGLVVATGVPQRLEPVLQLCRNELFDVGADLATPIAEAPKYPPLRVEQRSINRLESWCDEFSTDLPTLKSFILPGGSPASSQLHIARTVTRRAEREGWAAAQQFGLDEVGGVTSRSLTYLNRFSDLLFVLARYCAPDPTLWVPGTDREKPPAEPGNSG